MTQRKPASESETTTVIGSPMRITGKVSGQEDIRVEGAIEGSVHLEDADLHIEPGAVVQADVSARCVFVGGIVVGDLTASDRVILRETARCVGDISTPRLIVEPGAAVRGKISAEGVEPRARSTRAKAEVETPAEVAAPAKSAKTPRPPAKAQGNGGSAQTATSAKKPPERVSKPRTSKTKSKVRARVPARGKHRVARSTN
ncbi:MAG: polymer-forming cytoskeletal protein [Nannocystaceae bacterium]|nr:polymer-forming cytoskeletal protein [Myxococcales bacterium]